MLRFLFDSDTTTERNDTKVLYERFRAAQGEAGLHEQDSADDIAAVFTSLEREWGLSPASEFGGAVQSLFDRLVGDSDLYDQLQLATDSFVDNLELDAENRARMIRKISLYENVGINRRNIQSVLSNVSGTLLTNLPESVFDKSNEGHQVFEIRLLDILSEPTKIVSQMLGIFQSNNLQNTALFHHLRETLNANVEYVHQNIRRNARPEDLTKDHSDIEIVDLFLRNTNLKDIFDLKVPFVIPERIRFEHMHIVAGSGHGKTQTLQYIISRDIAEVQKGNMGFAVIDSQGDLINEILNRQAISDLQDKVILVDPNDIAYPPSLNMFDVGLSRTQNASPVEREKIINGTVDLYSYIFSSLLGAELTQKQGVIFTYLARMMMVIPNANIHTLRELVEDGKQFKVHFDKLDPSSRHFFEHQFFSKTFSATRQQVLTRLWGVLSNSTFEKMFSARENKIDLFDAMNEGKIVLINTAKDLLKSEGCSIFGRFFIALIAQAALSRSVLPVEKRKPFFVTIDEAHDYFDDKVEDIANQARKYNVGLTLSHQNLDQASQKLRASIMSSTSIKMAGGVSAKDAQVLAQNMHAKSDDLLKPKKSKKQTQFACFVRNLTPAPILIDIPFGALEGMPKISQEVREQFCMDNRKRIAQEPDYADHEFTEECDSEFSSEKSVGIELEQPSRGKGGSRHIEIQNLIAEVAKENGLEARIENHIGEGQHIDVVIYASERKIACEISVSTSIVHEISNVEKAIKTGHEEMWVVSDDGDWRKNFASALAKSELKNIVQILSVDEVLNLINEMQPHARECNVGGRVVSSVVREIEKNKKEIREIVLAKILS